ncbi:NAD(P)H-binding protein [Sphingomicrobium sp. XHP0239]|uniref:NAD(P)H-binding protein n=1 Tax=Sphingomicrobium maritimum TaxID=3133972 RepID=UPI0031CCBFEE
MTRIALIGASGLIGSRLVPLLSSHDVLSLARRSTESDRGHVTEKLGEMSEWPDLLDGERVDVAIGTTGTTWAKAKDWEKYDRIDRHGVVEFARAAQSAGATRMIVVSSSMADATSKNRYLAIKGQMEADLESLGFERLDIVRPGLLRGKRGSERRWKERLGILVSPLVNPLLPRKLRSVDAETVARAIAALVEAPGKGRFIHHNEQIKTFAGSGAAS